MRSRRVRGWIHLFDGLGSKWMGKEVLVVDWIVRVGIYVCMLIFGRSSSTISLIY